MATKDYCVILDILVKNLRIGRSGYSGEEQITGMFVSAEKIEKYFKDKKNVTKTKT
jgi:hypothetical protein